MSEIVYVLSNPAMPGLHKIGMTDKDDLTDRMKELYTTGKTAPSVASEGIAADITKIPDGYGVLFVVYDPERGVIDDSKFIESFENKRDDCFVRIYR